MKRSDLYIFSMCIIHVVIWLFVAFGGFLSNKILFINLLILLPIFYLTQSMSNHPIIKNKVKYILTHMDEFEEPETFVSPCYNQITNSEIEHLQKELGYSRDEIIKAVMIVKGYEDCFIFPKIINYGYRNFCDSYRNPFDTHGLLIFCYILNSYIFVYKNYNLILKYLW